MKKILSLLLTLSMLLSLVVLPAKAESTVPTVTLLPMSFTEGAGRPSEGTALTAIKGGEHFMVKALLTNTTDSDLSIGAFGVHFAYNSNAFEPYSYEDEDGEIVGPYTGAKPKDGGLSGSWNITPNLDKDGEALVQAMIAKPHTLAAGASLILGYFLMTAKSTAETNDYSLSFITAEGELNKNSVVVVAEDGSTSRIPNIDYSLSNSASVHVNGTAPVLDRITVMDTDGKIVLDSKAQNQSHRVEINGTTDYTYQAHAYSKMGTDITSSVTWTIGTVASNNGTVITTGGANAGQIVVAKNAMPISAAVEAKLDNVTANAGNFVVGRTQESKDTITSLSISCANTILTVPTGDKTETATFSVEAKNIYGEIIPNPSIVWKIADSSGGNLASNSNSGVTLTRGVLTLTSKTKSYTGNYTVYAYTNTAESNKIPVTIKLADPEATELEIDANATTTFAIPKADETGHGTEKNYSLPAVTVKDQYGRDVENPTLTWQTMGSKESSGMIHVVYSGIKIENGKLVVTSEAAKPELFPEGKNEYQVPIRVSCSDEKFADFTVTVTREARKAASVAVSGGPTAALLVPGSDESAVTSNEKFTAVVKDQYGHTIEGASVTWSAMMGSAAMTPVAGVSMTADGAVTVESTAAEKVFDTNAITFTAIAEYVDENNDAVDGYKNFTVARAASVVKSISIASASDTVEIPGSVTYWNSNFNGPESDKTMQFTVTAKDQYGADMAAPDLNWSIAPEVTGVEISTNGTLTVKSDAAQKIQNSWEFTVTATSKKDSAVTGTKTITVQRGAQRFVGFNLYKSNADGTQLGEALVKGGVGSNQIAAANSTQTIYFMAKPCDQYGKDMTVDGISYEVKFLAKDGTGWKKTEDASHFVHGSDSTPAKMTIETDANKPAAGDYEIQVVRPETGKVVISNYYVKLMRKADAGLKVTKPGGGYVSDTLELAYGDVMDKLSITVDKTSGSYGVKWLSSDPSVLSITNSTGTTPTLTARKPGTATVTVTYEDSENYGSKTFTVNVSKRVLTVTEGSFKISKVYDGNTNVPGFTGDFAVSNRLEKDSVNIACNLYPAYPSANVGNYTNELTLTLKGKDADNYTLKSDKVSVPYEITPASLTVDSADAVNRGYVAGKTDVGISSVTFTNTSDTTVVPGTGDYDARGVMSDANAGTKDVTVTVMLTGQAAKNYTLTNKTCKTTVSIDKIDWAGVKTGDMKIKYGNTATLDLKTIGLPDGYQFGSIDHSKTDGYSIIGSAVLNGDILSVTLVDNSGYIGKKAQVIVRGINSTNYNEYAIIVDVEMIDKSAQTIEADDVIMTYGNSAQVNVKNASALHGAVSYSVTGGSDVIRVDSNGKITALKSGTATVEISAAGDSDYAAATKSITVTVAKRTLTVKAADKSAYIGEKLPELTYQVTGLVTGDELTVKPVLEVKHAADVDPMKKVGEYEIGFKVAPAASANYELTTATGKLTVSVRPVYIGPIGSPVEVGRSDNGTVTVSPANAAKGTTVTITANPGKDQKLKSLEVIDQNGNSLPLTDLGNGKFSFVMPDGKVTVKPVFGAADACVNPYMDVQTNDWYFGAVQYVTENGLMNGTGNGFEPNLATSRAMIWTILARMSNVNTASGGEWYAVAQQWAKKNGVSDGTMPNGTITREQLAAMLYRYAVSKGMVKAPVTANLSIFADASSVSTYANEAMQWAVSTGLINGMDGKLNPQGSATRAQVATMLMRFAELLK